MAKATFPMLFLALLLHSSVFGGMMKVVNGQQKTWCVAKPSTQDVDLQNNIEYACRFVNCTIIQPNGKCFYPNILMYHASVAMNLYYQTMGRKNHECDFTNSGLISVTDPSNGDCDFA